MSDRIFVDTNVVRMEPEDLLQAIDLHQRYQMSIWDSLIVRAAIVSGCETLYTETCMTDCTLKS